MIAEQELERARTRMRGSAGGDEDSKTIRGLRSSCSGPSEHLVATELVCDQVATTVVPAAAKVIAVARTHAASTTGGEH